MVGAPPWAADLASAAELLAEKGTQGFVLSSSYGLSGWILARKPSWSGCSAAPFMTLKSISAAAAGMPFI
jgi:hypothetical protein